MRVLNKSDFTVQHRSNKNIFREINKKKKNKNQFTFFFLIQMSKYKWTVVLTKIAEVFYNFSEPVD